MYVGKYCSHQNFFEDYKAPFAKCGASEKYMRHISEKNLFFALMVAFFASGSTGWAQDSAATETPTPPIDAEAVEILAGATDFHASQALLSVNWFVSYDKVIDGREKITGVRSGFSLLDRDAGFYSFAENGMDTREYYFDGASFQIVAVEENAYAMTPFNGNFEGLVVRAREEYDVVLPIWTVLSRTSRGELLDTADHVAYLSLTRVAGREAHHLALSNYDGDWQVWIAVDDARPELLMMVGTDPYQQGWPQYRAYFSDWNFAPEIPEGAFTYIPDDTVDRMAWPKVPPDRGLSERSVEGVAE